MAVLFGRMRSISKGHGSSAMTAAAYRSCSKLVQVITDHEINLATDITYDYSGKKGLVFSEIFAPKVLDKDGNVLDIPGWVYDRQSLWQRIEDIETRINAEFAKEYVVALPKELTTGQNIELLKEFIETSFTSRGMVVDVNYHADNPENPHAHIMFPMRSLELNQQGEIVFGGKERGWKSFGLLNQIKNEQQIIINEHYRKHGFEYNLKWETVDGLEATFHHGGIQSLQAHNQEIIQRNASRIIADPSLVIDKLDHSKSVFTRSDIEGELEKALQLNVSSIKQKNKLENATKTSSERETSLDIYVKNEVTKMLDTVLLSPKLTLVNASDLKGRMLFAKTSQIELEQRFISQVKELNSKQTHHISINDTDIAPLGTNKAGEVLEFTSQQKEIIKNTLAGRNISIIEGWPGAGKTTVTKEIVRHYQESGYEIIAAAPTNKAAQELGEKLGVKAHTLAALRIEWQRQKGFDASIGLRSDYYKEPEYSTSIINSNDGPVRNNSIINKKTILIMDEISMIDLPTFDYFAHEVAQAGAKIIGLGDNNQNQAIGMKGAAAKAIEIAGSNLLTEINRHQNSDEYIRNLHIEASSSLSRYQVAKALSIYDQLGCINIHDTEDAKEQSMFNSYIDKLFEVASSKQIEINQATSKVAMIAYTNAEVTRLNVMVRDSLKRSGVLSATGVNLLSGGTHGKSELVELCEGDQIIFKSNQPQIDGYGGVFNNEIATIRKIIKASGDGRGEFVASVARGDETHTVIIRTGEEGRPISFRHAYALTNYAVQGSSIDHILMSVDKHSGYEVTMVGLTRHKQDCQIFAAKETLENEVYRTKDLDIAKVKEEYQVLAYEYKDGQKLDVPLWKIGLNLLTSKRSDLNFASDYRVGFNQTDRSSKIEEIMIAQTEISELRKELESDLYIVNSYEHCANSPYGDEREENKHFTQIELLAKEHFDLRAGDIEFNARDMLDAHAKYNKLVKSEDEYLTIEEHVRVLKTGILKNGERVPLRWPDLSHLDQNLVVSSYLEDGIYQMLETHISNIVATEERIRDRASVHADLLSKIAEETAPRTKDLTGNYAAVRDYLEAKKAVQDIYAARENGVNGDSNNNDSLKTPIILNKEDLDAAYSLRETRAKILIDNYYGHVDGKIGIRSGDPTMSKVISQLGLNYQTIAKHAGVENDKHYFRKTRFGSIVCDEHYSVIMDAALKATKGVLTDSDARNLSEAHGTIVEKIAATDEYLDQLKNTRKQFAYAEARDKKAYSAARLFTIQEFHSYISSIFKSPMAARHSLDSLLVESDNKGQLVLAISKNPDMLGELKERGIVAKLLKPEEANKVNTNLSHFTERLKQYIAEVKIMSEIEPKLDSNYYGKQISIIDKEIASIKASLPNNEEIELLEKISQIETKCVNHNTNQLDSKTFINGISELFKEDRQVNLLLNWQMHQAKLEEYKLEKVKSGSAKGREYELAYDNRNARQNNLQSQQHQRLERLNFNDVSKELSVSDYESIFRRYAQVINPDGKIVKRGSSIGCGSLNMNLQNGLWNRFSTGDSGNIFGLVSFGMRVNKLEALEIVAEHAGIKPETNGYFRTRNTHERFNRAVENNEDSVKKELRDDWLQTNTRSAKAFEPDDLKFMLKSNKITDIYEYKNIYSETLGYTVRMEDIKTHKKQVLPVTYCYNEKLDQSRWQLKGFTDAKTKPIYSIEKLAEHPEKPILIVEGEKTASKAQALLSGHNVISWMGGARSVDKVDWSKLASRSVVIWPDNDKPGIDAANNIANHIDCQNGYSGLVSIVDTEKLALPEKWDLADKVPASSKLANIGINGAIEKAKDNNRTIGDRLEASQEMSKYSGKGNEVLGSIAMLVETGKISKDEYVSRAIYFNTITAISDSKGLDLSAIGIEGHKDFIEAINDISYEYQSLQSNYTSEQAKQTSNIGEGHSQLPTLSSKEQLAHDLIRDISILHQVQLGQNKLTTVHAEHIVKTVNAEIENMQRFTDSDKEHAANSIYKVINSEEWRKGLEIKNQEHIEHDNKKLAAKTIGEYTSLMHEANTKYNHGSGSIADHNQIIAKIKNASNYLADNNIKTQEQLLKLYKTHVTPESIHKALVHECRERNIHVIKHNLDILGKNKIIHIGDKPFTYL
jgi:ATP-dependent exoDNAse (exonuclease V) alpha subunit